MSTPVAKSTTAAPEGTSRKWCKYHYKCSKSSDPEHQKNFVCVYQKPCRNGPSCHLVSDPTHQQYFSHQSLKHFESSVREAVTAFRQPTVPRALPPPRRPPPPPVQRLTPENSVTVEANFTVEVASQRMSHTTSGVFTTRVPKTHDGSQIEEQLTRFLHRKFCGRQPLSKTNIVVKYHVVEPKVEDDPEDVV